MPRPSATSTVASAPMGSSEESSTGPAIARAILQLHQSDIFGTRGHDKPVVPSNQGGAELKERYKELAKRGDVQIGNEAYQS